MPTNAGASVTLGVEDYLMAFKKKGNQDAVKEFLDLYYQPENITRWIAAEGFLPVTKSGLRQMSDNAEAQAVPGRAAQRAAGAHHRSRLGQGEARRAAEHRAGRAAGRRPAAGARVDPEERRGRGGRPLTPLHAAGRGRGGRCVWLGPSLALIVAVVLYPAVRARPRLVRSILHHRVSTRGRSAPPTTPGCAEQAALPAVVANTVVWVVVVVGVTLLISLGLAQFLNLEFPGRRLVRWALIVPWAASLIMTAKLFVWIYDYYFGVLNHALVVARPAPAAGRLAGRRRAP